MATTNPTCRCGRQLRPVRGLQGFEWRRDGWAIYTHGGQREIGGAILQRNRHDVVVRHRTEGGISDQRTTGKCCGVAAGRR